MLSLLFLLSSIGRAEMRGIRRPHFLCLVNSVETLRNPKGIHLSDNRRTGLNKAYGNQDIANPQMNRQFMDIKDGLSDTNAQLFLDVESAVLKDLNDLVVKDKELVTALTNKYKILLAKNIENDPYLRKHKVATYSDFKSVRMAFGNASDPSMDLVLAKRKLKEAFEATNSQFHTFARNNNIGILPSIKGASSNPEAWHMAGVWDTADKASLASRRSRKAKLIGQTFTDGFELSNNVENDLRSLEKMRKSLSAAFADSHNGMLSPTPNGKLVLSRDSAEVIRKIKAPVSSGDAYLGALKNRMKERFAVDLSEDQARLIKDYYNQADMFSPAIYTEKRIIIPFEKADHGALSVDLKGLGAENAYQTLSALADNAGRDADTILAATRHGELLATENLTLRGEIFDNAVSRFEKRRRLKADVNKLIHATGDDEVYMPPKDLSPTDLQNFLSKDLESAVSDPQELSGYRIVYSSQKSPGAGLDVRYISDGEDFEKAFRLSVERQNPELFEKLQNSYMALFHESQGNYRAYLRKESFSKSEYTTLKNILNDLSHESKPINITSIDFI